MKDIAEELLGPPVTLHELKNKPGRRQTLRATGSRGTAIVKVYASERAPVVAARVAALAAGPCPLRVPAVLHLDAERHLVFLSDVPGVPLRHAVLAGDLDACRRAGQALGHWHAAWAGRDASPLRAHTAERELEALLKRAATAPLEVTRAVTGRAPALAAPWPQATVVHRDLYEEQLLLDDDGRVGLIDLDDAALGPPELDLGNLLAHLDLLALRTGRSLDEPAAALLAGHTSAAGSPDAALLARCRALTRLRLACIHREPALLTLVRAPGHRLGAGQVAGGALRQERHRGLGFP